MQESRTTQYLTQVADLWQDPLQPEDRNEHAPKIQGRKTNVEGLGGSGHGAKSLCSSGNHKKVQPRGNAEQNLTNVAWSRRTDEVGC